MPRSYRHMQDYEKEIMELREQGLTGRQIWSIRNFIFLVDMYRYCRNWHPLIYCFSSIKFSLSMIKDT